MSILREKLLKTQERIFYPRYFWHGRKRYSTKPIHSTVVTPLENKIFKFTKKYAFSSRNLNFKAKNRTKVRVQDRYPFLFDSNEVAHGYYSIPRFYKDENGELKLVDKKDWGMPWNIGNRTGIYPVEFTTLIKIGKQIIKIPKPVNLNRWRYYPKKQCPTTIIIGKMGGGKSVLENYLINLCLDTEASVSALDHFIEAKHLAQTGQIHSYEKMQNKLTFPSKNKFHLMNKNFRFNKFVILTPVEIWYHQKSKLEFQQKKYIELPNITEHTFETEKEIISSMGVGKVVGVYDENLVAETKNRMWYDIAYKLNRRSKKYTVMLSHHESSLFLPSHPVKGKFFDVQEFADEFVSFRKADVRTLFGQQLHKEGFWRTNQKALYLFYKQGSLSDYIQNRKKMNMVNSLAKDEFLVEHSGSYSVHNSPNFPEIDGIKGETELLTLADVVYKPDELANQLSPKQELKKAYRNVEKQQEYNIIIEQLKKNPKTKTTLLQALIDRSREYTAPMVEKAKLDLGLLEEELDGGNGRGTNKKQDTTQRKATEIKQTVKSSKGKRKK